MIGRFDPLRVAAFILLSLALIASIAWLIDSQPYPVPACQEDEVIVGYGEFDNGYSDKYRCVNFEEVEGEWGKP